MIMMGIYHIRKLPRIMEWRVNSEYVYTLYIKN